ncbi:MAG: HAMP domain-containing histidine kinase [Kiritimatiellae bacterium]|nr:HAMP domain-containing histidine kinase [Kiritimatiellia bacterium]
MSRSRVWIAPALATAAFVAALVVFVVALSSYYKWMVEWSSGDLRSRAEMTAAALSEPLRTLDYKTIDAAAARLRNERLRLRICAGRSFFVSEGESRTGFYDTLGEPDPPDVVCQWGVAAAGDFQVGIGRPVARLIGPFVRALAVVALAGLVGIMALAAVFVILYRQRVRIGELAKLERFRRDFVADVSHEIRTPLTGILGAVDLLDDASPDAVRTSLAPLIRKESKRLSSLVQQILDLARLEREGDVLNREEADVVGLAKEVAEKYGASFRSGVSEPLPVMCDAQLVSQALSNLVENAFRHSGSKEVSVSCAADAKKVRLSVEDRGVGIPPEHASRIFERFHRVDPARAAESGGAGLGLAIVRRIARLHGGDAVYESVAPHGSRFTISLPVRP